MNHVAMQSRQRGLSLSSLLIAGFLLVLVSIVGLKLIPYYMQDATIKNLFVVIAHDPEMRGASVAAIRESYSKRSSIENITVIGEGDVEIAKDGDSVSLSAAYDVKVPLVANVSLYLEFHPSSDSN